jgi:hypothetical protein
VLHFLFQLCDLLFEAGRLGRARHRGFRLRQLPQSPNGIGLEVEGVEDDVGFG